MLGRAGACRSEDAQRMSIIDDEGGIVRFRVSYFGDSSEVLERLTKRAADIIAGLEDFYEVRADDEQIRSLIAPLNHPPTWAATMADVSNSRFPNSGLACRWRRHSTTRRSTATAPDSMRSARAWVLS